ncbi:MAG: hypothetical protein WAN76_06505, partial [Candidatus Sulfotelmatobacter sp.]
MRLWRGLAERALTSISEHINSVPNGSNYLERLTAKAKTFKVPIERPAATLRSRRHLSLLVPFSNVQVESH